MSRVSAVLVGGGPSLVRYKCFSRPPHSLSWDSAGYQFRAGTVFWEGTALAREHECVNTLTPTASENCRKKKKKNLIMHV